MSLQPLREAPWIIQLHAYAAFAAFALGLFQLAAPKGTLPHKTLGAVWIVLMTIITVSSVFVRPALYPGLPLARWFSFIHIFTIVTAFGLISGSLLLLKGGPALKNHARPFIGIFIGGLIIAGAFAFMPGRIMHAVAFGG